MIRLLRGVVATKSKSSLTLMTPGGVGYEVGLSLLQLTHYREGEEVTLYTYLKVSDSSLDLYGFESEAERTFFELLLTVKSVGPKSAMTILSLGSIENIQSAIARGDVDYLTAVQGLGRKTAERVVVELKSKVKSQKLKDENFENQGTILGEVVDALVALGYSRDEAKNMVARLPNEEKTTEELLKLALRQTF